MSESDKSIPWDSTPAENMRLRAEIDRLTARAEAAEAELRKPYDVEVICGTTRDGVSKRIAGLTVFDPQCKVTENFVPASRARREALEEAARHLEEEADVLDAQRAELITSGTLNGRRVANEALRKRLARDNRVVIEKLLFDAQYIRALIDSEKGG